MRTVSILVPILIGNALGCGDDPRPSAATISITSDKAPALVAFRDGLDAPWQVATRKTPTTFEVVAHGPYLVTVACEDLTIGDFTTWQIARTLDDDHDVTLPCDFIPSDERQVTGHMVQAGYVQLGSSIDLSGAAGWDFELHAPNGSHDLIAVGDDRIAVHRALAITRDLALPPIDLAQGTALTGVAFSVTNATPDETVLASIGLRTATTPEFMFGARVYTGPIATAKVAPDSALVATDLQNASMQAQTDTTRRSLSRPFKLGGNTAYTLPAPIGGLQWDVARGEVSASWTSMPELDDLEMLAYSFNDDFTELHFQNLEISGRFVEETGITTIAIDTDIPGYKPAWKIDLTREYLRELVAQHTANGEIANSSVSETVHTPTARVRPAPRHARALDRHLAARP